MAKVTVYRYSGVYRRMFARDIDSSRAYLYQTYEKAFAEGVAEIQEEINELKEKLAAAEKLYADFVSLPKDAIEVQSD